MKVLLLSILLVISSGSYGWAQKKNIHEGDYHVSFAGWAVDSRDPFIGMLKIKEGNYSFQVADKLEMTGSSSSAYPPFCFEYPTGTYLIEYAAGITDNTILEQLEDHTILLTMKFISNGKEIYSTLLRYNKTNNKLYFHSEKSELELWVIEK